MGPWICREDTLHMHMLQKPNTDQQQLDEKQLMMLKESREVCVELNSAGEGGRVRDGHGAGLDCFLVLQPDNLNSYKLNQLSGLQLGATSGETEKIPGLEKVLNPVQKSYN